MDYSTIDTDVLSQLPLYTLPATYRLGDMGMGCYGDAPGYPTYFMRPVYSQYGNSPRNAPDAVIVIPGYGIRIVVGKWGKFDTQEKRDARRAKLFSRLYKPLPADHPRVLGWIAAAVAHSSHCYQDVDRPEYGRPGTLIYPVPYYKLKTPAIDVNWTAEYKAAVQAEADIFNRQEIDRATAIAIPENHRAVIRVREIYPDMSPAAILATTTDQPGSWWETEAERPTPETCQPRSMGKHPLNVTWCQHCGWKADDRCKACGGTLPAPGTANGLGWNEECQTCVDMAQSKGA